jgi:hypothetical protein
MAKVAQKVHFGSKPSHLKRLFWQGIQLYFLSNNINFVVRERLYNFYEGELDTPFRR